MKERRMISEAVELRQDEGQPVRLSGYAAVYYRADDPGTEFALTDSITERIAPGAFAGIEKHDIRALFNHDSNNVLGRSTAGTLRLSEDAKGLRYEVDLPDTTLGRDIHELVKRGDVSGSSFAFQLGADGQEVERREDGSYIRTITKFAGIFDVGPVVYPAYEATKVDARSIEAAADKWRDDKNAAERATYKGEEIDTTPTDAMVEEAERGLDWREEYGRGGTEVGVARARDIANRRNLSIETVQRMSSYFARHEVDKDAEGFSAGEDGYPSAGRIAWALWGGDAGAAFARRVLDRVAAIDAQSDGERSNEPEPEALTRETVDIAAKAVEVERNA